MGYFDFRINFGESLVRLCSIVIHYIHLYWGSQLITIFLKLRGRGLKQKFRQLIEEQGKGTVARHWNPHWNMRKKEISLNTYEIMIIFNHIYKYLQFNKFFLILMCVRI